jgi:cardiolipin synthase
VLPQLTPAELARDLTGTLPHADVERLAAAVASGPEAVRRLRDASAPPVRQACSQVLALGASAELAGALRGAAAVRTERRTRVDVVWSGPDDVTGAHRLTASVLVDLVAAARFRLLLIGYAVHSEPRVAEALREAAGRSVEVTLLLERPHDNPAFTAASEAFPDLQARRLAWPAGARPGGASLHAKVLAVDDDRLLVGSANVTGAALDRNLECGLLVRGDVARRVHDHVEALLHRGILVRL